MACGPWGRTGWVCCQCGRDGGAGAGGEGRAWGKQTAERVGLFSSLSSRLNSCHGVRRMCRDAKNQIMVLSALVGATKSIPAPPALLILKLLLVCKPTNPPLNFPNLSLVSPFLPLCTMNLDWTIQCVCLSSKRVKKKKKGAACKFNENEIQRTDSEKKSWQNE